MTRWESTRDRHRFFWLLLVLFLTPLFAQKIELLAQKVVRHGNIVEAYGDVTVHYRDRTATADYARYDKKQALLILEGNVTQVTAEGEKSLSDRVVEHVDEKRIAFTPFFYADKEDMWVYALRGVKSSEEYNLTHAILSSCDAKMPLWKLYFDHAKFAPKEDYIKLYHTVLYLADIPIFYSPFLAFSVNKTRRSGFLFPSFGYNKREGFIYEQPFFWAIDPSQDIEFVPQWRSKRSIGLYATYRFVDSPHSSGMLRAGYFKDKHTFALENKLQRDKHYGVEVLYSNGDLLGGHKPRGYRDGLYLKGIYLNDIDYLNLQRRAAIGFGVTSLQESRLNYFLYSNNYYGGINAKYYIDTNKKSNRDTLQILPSINLHKHTAEILGRNVLYSLDLSARNITRIKGSRLFGAEFRLPIEWYRHFLGDYLLLSLKETLFFGRYYFSGAPLHYKTFRYSSNIHALGVGSDLYRRYGDILHVFSPKLELIYPGNEHESPVGFNILDESVKRLFSVGLPEEEARFSLNNYIYKNGTLLFYDRFFQSYFPKREYSFSQLKNEFDIRFYGYDLYNELIWVPRFHGFRRISTHLSKATGRYSWSIGHTYQRHLPDRPLDIAANDLYFDFSYRYSDHTRFYGGLAYSIEEQRSRFWRLGGSYSVPCWSLDAEMRRDIVPRPEGFSREDSFYLQLNFRPFGSIGTGGRR